MGLIVSRAVPFTGAASNRVNECNSDITHVRLECTEVVSLLRFCESFVVNVDV